MTADKVADGTHNIAPSGYDVIHEFRPDGAFGGGIAVVFRRHFDVKKVKLQFVADSFESLVVKLLAPRGRINIAALYRSPTTSPRGVAVWHFCADLRGYLDELLLLPGEPLLCGDVNCPRKNVISVHTSLDDLLSSRRLVQRVVGPTHYAGNLLDVLITEKHSMLSKRPTVIDVDFSDHMLVLSELNVHCSKQTLNPAGACQRKPVTQAATVGLPKDSNPARYSAKHDGKRYNGWLSGHELERKRRRLDQNSDMKSGGARRLRGQFSRFFATNRRTESDIDNYVNAFRQSSFVTP